MIEQMRDIDSSRDHFLHTIITRQAADNSFDDLSPEPVASHEFNSDTMEQLFPDYFEADKSLGAINKGSLLATGAMCLAYAHTESVPRHLKIDVLELGASTLQEAAFMESVASHNSLEQVDERLKL